MERNVAMSVSFSSSNFNILDKSKGIQTKINVSDKAV